MSDIVIIKNKSKFVMKGLFELLSHNSEIRNTPASEKEIQEIEKSLKLEIPDVYKQFLLKTNGMVHDLCVLYGTDDIVDSYINNQLAEYASGYLSIGNDNGDRELIIKADKKAIMCGFIDAGAIGTAEPDEWFNFSEWLKAGCMILSDDDSFSSKGDIVIISIPDDKIKFILDIRSIFSLKMPMNELRNNLEHLPYTIVEDIKYSKAEKLIARMNCSECIIFSKKKTRQ